MLCVMPPESAGERLAKLEVQRVTDKVDSPDRPSWPTRRSWAPSQGVALRRRGVMQVTGKSRTLKRLDDRVIAVEWAVITVGIQRRCCSPFPRATDRGTGHKELSEDRAGEEGRQQTT
jgi:hypothetical protein